MRTGKPWWITIRDVYDCDDDKMMMMMMMVMTMMMAIMMMSVILNDYAEW